MSIIVYIGTVKDMLISLNIALDSEYLKLA